MYMLVVFLFVLQLQLPRLHYTESSSLLNISAKRHQNRALYLWAIPFQRWCTFWTVYFIQTQFDIWWASFANISSTSKVL